MVRLMFCAVVCPITHAAAQLNARGSAHMHAWDLNNDRILEAEGTPVENTFLVDPAEDSPAADSPAEGSLRSLHFPAGPSAKNRGGHPGIRSLPRAAESPAGNLGCHIHHRIHRVLPSKPEPFRAGIPAQPLCLPVDQ